MEMENLKTEINLTKNKIESLQEKINALNIEKQTQEHYLQGLEFFRKNCAKSARPKKGLRSGSTIAKVHEILQEAAETMHIDKILKCLGNEEKSHKLSLSSTLTQYAKSGKIFTKPFPNAFGLIEFQDGDESD